MYVCRCHKKTLHKGGNDLVLDSPDPIASPWPRKSLLFLRSAPRRLPLRPPSQVSAPARLHCPCPWIRARVPPSSRFLITADALATPTWSTRAGRLATRTMRCSSRWSRPRCSLPTSRLLLSLQTRSPPSASSKRKMYCNALWDSTKGLWGFVSRVQVLPFCLQKVMNTTFLYLSYVSPRSLHCPRVVVPSPSLTTHPHDAYPSHSHRTHDLASQHITYPLQSTPLAIAYNSGYVSELCNL